MANVFKLYIVENYATSISGEVDLSAYIEKWTPVAPSAGDTTLIESIDLVNVTLADWEKLENLLSLARLRSETGFGVQIYFEYDLDVSRSAYHSEIFDGQMVTGENNLGSDIANAKYNGTLIIKRAAYWELKTEVELATTNANGTSTPGTNASVITNCNDGTGTPKRNNYIELNDYVSVGPGTLGVRLEPKAAFYARKIIIGILNSDTFAHNLEAADGSSQSSAASSGGTFFRHALNTSMTLLESWDLTAESTPSDVTSYRNCSFMVVARFAAAPPTDTYAQVTMGGEYIGPVVKLNTNLMQVIDIVRIPAGAYKTYDPNFKLYAKGSGNLDVDFITLLPTESYAIVEMPATELGVGDFIAVTQKYGAYFLDATTSTIRQVPMSGPGIFLRPDNGMLGDSRLIVVWSTGSAGDGWTITNSFDIYIYHQARLWTI